MLDLSHGVLSAETMAAQQTALDKALALVERRQSECYQEMIKGFDTSVEIDYELAEAALRAYSHHTITFQLNVETVVYLAFMLNAMNADSIPLAKKIRDNFVAVVANTVGQLDPRLAAMALANTLPRKLTTCKCQCQPKTPENPQ